MLHRNEMYIHLITQFLTVYHENIYYFAKRCSLIRRRQVSEPWPLHMPYVYMMFNVYCTMFWTFLTNETFLTLVQLENHLDSL